MAPTHIVGIPDSDGNLDEFDTEDEVTRSAAARSVMEVVEPGPPPGMAGPPPALSRPEALRLRRPRRWPLKAIRRAVWRPVALAAAGVSTLAGYLLALCAFAALRGDSFAAFLERTARAGALRAGRHGLDFARAAHASAERCVASTREHSQVALDAARAQWQTWQRRPATHVAVSRSEWEGAAVAVALGVVAFAYGGLLVVSWRNQGAASTTAVLTHTTAAAIGGLPATAVIPPPHFAGAAPRVVDERPQPHVIKASTLTSIWRRNDTRSLQRAFDNLRRETLALHSCGMEMTATDRAVARCDSTIASAGTDGDGLTRRVRWTIDFQRTGNRWAIQRVSTR